MQTDEQTDRRLPGFTPPCFKAALGACMFPGFPSRGNDPFPPLLLSFLSHTLSLSLALSFLSLHLAAAKRWGGGAGEQKGKAPDGTAHY